MNPYFIFKNPIIKVICLCLVLYFALFKNKDNPHSLGNRLSVDKIKHNVEQANQKGFSIVSGIALAKRQEESLKRGNINYQEAAAQDSDANNQEIIIIKRDVDKKKDVDNSLNNSQNSRDQPNSVAARSLTGDHIIVWDLETGSGNEVLSCGRSADISYKIIAKNNNQEIAYIPNTRILVGGGTNLLLENKIIGMKKGGLRQINVLQSFKTEDQKLAMLLKRGSDLIYQVRLIAILPPNKINNNNVRCD